MKLYKPRAYTVSRILQYVLSLFSSKFIFTNMWDVQRTCKRVESEEPIAKTILTNMRVTTCLSSYSAKIGFKYVKHRQLSAQYITTHHQYCKDAALWVHTVTDFKDMNLYLNRKFRYKRQLARPRCHSFVNQQCTR